MWHVFVRAIYHRQKTCLTIYRNKVMSTEQNDTQSHDIDDGVFLINATNQKGGTPITVGIQINGKGVKMDLS